MRKSRGKRSDGWVEDGWMNGWWIMDGLGSGWTEKSARDREEEQDVSHNLPLAQASHVGRGREGCRNAVLCKVRIQDGRGRGRRGDGGGEDPPAHSHQAKSNEESTHYLPHLILWVGEHF
ncbi:hypothetical protein E2C01_087808 [Portunus trituberculatus]|uniref:Uncharacterized protein n=1 Tax=Portunus trituberculatus TaxID=210409 RepID=A0A5B7JEC5_PORTR|nr:hypothetical protein [Portunus trituberculatus]